MQNQNQNIPLPSKQSNPWVVDKGMSAGNFYLKLSLIWNMERTCSLVTSLSSSSDESEDNNATGTFWMWSLAISSWADLYLLGMVHDINIHGGKCSKEKKGLLLESVL